MLLLFKNFDVYFDVAENTPPRSGLSGALYLDGVSGYFETVEYLTNSTDMTLELWASVYTTATNQVCES